nr:IS3 family transposase [Photorhabdus heterorhabditis]
MNVSRSAYYVGSRKVIDDSRLKIKVRLRELYSASRGTAGSRTLMHQLREAGIPVGRWKVRRLMKECSLTSRQPGGHRYRICPEESVASPNRVRREFLSHGNRIPLWCGDIGYTFLRPAMVFKLMKRGSRDGQYDRE